MSQRITSTFAIFGNFQMLTASEQLLKDTFNSFNCTIETEQPQPGLLAKKYIFRGANLAVVVRPFRIDMEFGYQANQTIDDFIRFVHPTVTLLDSVGVELASRIAYSCVEIIDNTNGVAVNKLSKAFGATDVFGTPAVEFNMRTNTLANLCDETFNSVVLIQDGRITNNQTKAQQSVVFINKDINSIISIKDERFIVKDSVKYLRDMIEESDNKTALIEAKLV